MAAKNEFHAQVGQLVNSVFSLVVRVIPFIFLGMAGAAYYGKGGNGETLWGDLVARFSFPGLTGLLVAAELAAYQGTVSTEMNWGASFLINDLYKRVLVKGKPDRHYVLAGRVATLMLLLTALTLAYFRVKGMLSWFLFINNVMIAFILPLAWLRFMWWRLNVWGEIAALAGGLPLSYVVWFVLDFAHKPFWQGFLLLFGCGWFVIVLVTLLTPPEHPDVLREFYRRCQPPGFWGPVTRSLPEAERQHSRREMRLDAWNCLLGIAFCGGAVSMTTSLFAGYGRTAVLCALVAGTAFAFFAWSWWNRGIFQALQDDPIGGRIASVSARPLPEED